jgi:hypothetical protein
MSPRKLADIKPDTVFNPGDHALLDNGFINARAVEIISVGEVFLRIKSRQGEEWEVTKYRLRKIRNVSTVFSDFRFLYTTFYQF